MSERVFLSFIHDLKCVRVEKRCFCCSAPPPPRKEFRKRLAQTSAQSGREEQKRKARTFSLVGLGQCARLFGIMVSSGSKKKPPRTPRTLQNAPPDCLRDVISPGQWRTAVQRYAELRRTAIHRERPTPPTSAIHRARPTTTPSTSATIFYEMIITVSSPIRAGQVAGPQLAGVEAS